MRKYLSSLLLIVSVCLCNSLDSAFACSCRYIPEYSVILRDPSIPIAFAGRIIAVTTASQFGNDSGILITFVVMKNWKGVTTPTITVLQEGTINSCSKFFFLPGQRNFDSVGIYLFAGRFLGKNIITHGCLPLIVTNEKGLAALSPQFDSLAALPPLPILINDDAFFKISVLPNTTTASITGFDIDVKFENAELGFDTRIIQYAGASLPLLQVAQIVPWVETTVAGIIPSIRGNARSVRGSSIIRYNVPSNLSNNIGQFTIYASFYNPIPLPNTPTLGMTTSATISVTQRTDVSRKKENSDWSINIYPNPIAEIINIEFESAQKSVKVTLLDVLGRVILSRKSEERLIQVDVNHLSSGFYVLQLQTENRIISRKLVKM